MFKVREVLRISDGRSVLVCDAFSDSVVTDRLKTTAGFFEKNSFYVETSKPCFSKPTTRHIMLRAPFEEAEKINGIEFT